MRFRFFIWREAVAMMFFVVFPAWGQHQQVDANIQKVGGALVSPSNRLPVTCDNCGNGTGGVGAADSSSFTAGSSVFAAIGGVYNDALTAVTSTKWATARITAYRAEHVNLRDNSGNEIGVSGAPMYVQFGTAQHIVCDSGCGSASSVLMADATANPTIPQAASFGMLYNGTSWDRWRGDTTSGAWINIKNASVAVTGTFWQATQPVSGTITANAGSGTFTNQQTNVTADYDTGAGTQTLTMFGVALPKSGGAVAGGTSTDPLRIDPTGATTQPISAASLPLPAGASTEATLAGIKTGTDKIPSSPATDRMTAASPFSVRLSDGAAFFDPRSIRALTSSDVVTVANTAFIANAGTNLNTSALALEAGGHLAAVDTNTTGAAKDATLAETHAAVAATMPSKDSVVGGSDYGGTPHVQTIKIDSSGNIYAILGTSSAVIGHIVVDSVTGTVTISGTVTATQASGANLHVNVDSIPTTTVQQSTGTNLHAVVDSAPTTAVTNAGLSNIPADPAREGGNLATLTAKDFATQTTLALIKAKTDNIPADPSREGGVLATATKQDTGNTSLGSIKTNTDPLVASGAGGYVRQDSTATIAKESGGNLATIATNTTGVATAANQTTQITTENTINSKLPSTVNGSQPVIVMQTLVVMPPVLTSAQLNNPLLYRSAMQQFCRTNICQPGASLLK